MPIPTTSFEESKMQAKLRNNQKWRKAVCFVSPLSSIFKLCCIFNERSNIVVDLKFALSIKFVTTWEHENFCSLLSAKFTEIWPSQTTEILNFFATNFSSTIFWKSVFLTSQLQKAVSWQVLKIEGCQMAYFFKNCIQCMLVPITLCQQSVPLSAKAHISSIRFTWDRTVLRI